MVRRLFRLRRRGGIPGHSARPPAEEPRSPLPAYQLKKLEKLGHRMRPFEQQRTTNAAEQERDYLSKCQDCGSPAIYTVWAPTNWTLEDALNEGFKGRASESPCSGTRQVTGRDTGIAASSRRRSRDGPGLEL